jgi:hypothetical protein
VGFDTDKVVAGSVNGGRSAVSFAEKIDARTVETIDARIAAITDPL